MRVSLPQPTNLILSPSKDDSSVGQFRFSSFDKLRMRLVGKLIGRIAP